MNDSYEINYQLSEEDYIRFNQIHYEHSRTGKRDIWIYRMLVPVFFVLILVTNYFAYEDNIFDPALIFLIIMSLIWVLLCKKLLFRSIRKKLIRMKKEGDLPFNKNGRLRFGEDTIIDQGNKMQLTLSYSDIHHIYKSESTMYLMYDAAGGIIVPVSDIDDSEELRIFLEKKTGLSWLPV